MRAPYLRCSPVASACPSVSGTAGMDSIGRGRRAFMPPLSPAVVSLPAIPHSGAAPRHRLALGWLHHRKESAMRNRLRQWGMFVALAWVATAGASLPYFGDGETRPWSEVQAVVDSVDGARPPAGAMKFEGQGQEYYLAPGGRLAMVSRLDASMLEKMREYDPEFDPETVPAMLGTWETNGSWLTIKATNMAFRSDAARDAAMKRMMGEFETDSDEE